MSRAVRHAEVLRDVSVRAPVVRGATSHPCEAAAPVKMHGSRRWQVAFCLACVACALWWLLVSALGHMSPDTSIYLLHTRTFLASLNRFALSHDSKGLAQVLFLAPTVLLFGPTVSAAAISQAVACLAAAVLFVRLLKTYFGLLHLSALTLAMLWLTAVYSPLAWGGRARPEDFALLTTMAAFAGAMAGNRGGLVWCGLAAALAFHLKPSLALTPLVLGMTAAHMGKGTARRVDAWLSLTMGFLIVNAVILPWIALMDDPYQWFRQTLAWPLEYKRAVGKSGLSIEGFSNSLALIQATRFAPLWVCGLVGAAFATLTRGRTCRKAAFVLVCLGSEWLRIVLENEPWHYLVTGLALPLMLGSVLLAQGINARRGRTVLATWAPTALCLLPILIPAIPESLVLVEQRIRQGTRAPYEALAEAMDPFYRKGESLWIDDFDYQLILHLDAPPPYPVLPLHLPMVSRTERSAALAAWSRCPPDWVIVRDPARSSVFHTIRGTADSLLYTHKTALSSSGAEAATLSGSGPSPEARRMLTNHAYRLVVDIGSHQAWRLAPPPP